MEASIDHIKEIYTVNENNKNIHVDNLKQIIDNTGELLEGNCFYGHLTSEVLQCLVYKQINIFWCGKQAQKKICEIGFNGGHSSMLMLLGRGDTPTDLTLFDIGAHSYIKPCFEYLKSKFTNVQFDCNLGDSIKTIPLWLSKNPDQIYTFDLVHVDGGHTTECIVNDMKNTEKLLNVGGIAIIDDTQIKHIDNVVEKYISTGCYIELKYIPTEIYTHRIIKKIKHIE